MPLVLRYTCATLLFGRSFQLYIDIYIFSCNAVRVNCGSQKARYKMHSVLFVIRDDDVIRIIVNVR